MSVAAAPVREPLARPDAWPRGLAAIRLLSPQPPAPHVHTAPAPAVVRVLLVDDHTLVRQALRSLLEATGGVEVVGEAETGRKAVELAARVRPDVVLMDLDMPGMNGLEATRQIRRSVSAKTRVLLLGTRVYEEHLLEFLRAGASGLVLKEAPASELLQALREVGRCEFYVSSALSHKVLSRWQRQGTPSAAGVPGWDTHAHTVTLPAPHEAEQVHDGRSAAALLHLRVVDDPLTERERELLHLVAAGYTNQQIAQTLCISVKTVEAHKAHMVTKLALRGSADLMRYAVQRHWLQARA